MPNFVTWFHPPLPYEREFSFPSYRLRKRARNEVSCQRSNDFSPVQRGSNAPHICSNKWNDMFLFTKHRKMENKIRNQSSFSLVQGESLFSRSFIAWERVGKAHGNRELKYLKPPSAEDEVWPKSQSWQRKHLAQLHISDLHPIFRKLLIYSIN